MWQGFTRILTDVVYVVAAIAVLVGWACVIGSFLGHDHDGDRVGAHPSPADVSRARARMDAAARLGSDVPRVPRVSDTVGGLDVRPRSAAKGFKR